MSAAPAPTFATAITLARATWGKTALVRLTLIADSWVASAGHTTTVGSGVDLPCTGCGDDAPAAIAALCEAIERPALDPADSALSGVPRDLRGAHALWSEVREATALRLTQEAAGHARGGSPLAEHVLAARKAAAAVAVSVDRLFEDLTEDRL